jgi:molybdopterin converting factor small subunit
MSNSANPAPSLQVTVNFYSTVRNITGEAQIRLEIPKNTKLTEVLQQIEAKYFQPKGSRLLSRDGEGLDAGLLCLIDDADYTLCGGLQQKLKNDLTLTLISSLHGG